MKYEEHELIAKLGEKISNMCKSIGEVEKDGENKHSHYAYISSDNLLAHIRANLAPNRLSIIPNLDSIEEKSTVQEGQNGKKYWTKTTVGMSFEIIDTETGYVKTLTWTGSDQDTGGKSMGQAITECTKRFYFKLFQVSSKEDKDIDSKTDEQEPIDDSGAMANALKPKNQPEKKEPQKPEPKKLGKWAKKLAKLAKSPLHQIAIQAILKEKKATPESIRSQDEEAASVVVNLIEQQKVICDAPAYNWPSKLTELKADPAYIKIINELVVSGDVRGQDLNTMHNETAKGLCELLERTKGFVDKEDAEQSETQPDDEAADNF
ncbi:MAG: hypothetical protein GWP06_02845 [Actinobacteria bacterium]|nr:hypothetical protein [Actinomycetota bacterium]